MHKEKCKVHGPRPVAATVNEGLNILKLKSDEWQDFSNTDSCGMYFHFQDSANLVSLGHKIKGNGHLNFAVYTHTSTMQSR